MEKIVVTSAVRTPIGSYLGALSDVPAYELGALVLNEGVNRADVDPSQVDEVIMGQSYQNGEYVNIARMALLKDMGVRSMILAYNDRFRTGSGSLVAYNGKDDGLTAWGRAVIDQLVRYGILLDLSHTGYTTATDGDSFAAN